MVKSRSSQSSDEKSKALFPELRDDNPKTPLCSELAVGSHKSELLLIHHLHETSLPYIRSLASGYKIRKVVGIPYSAVDSVVEELRKSFEVIVPPVTEDIKHIVRSEIVANPGARLIIDEIGGYTTKISGILDTGSTVVGAACRGVL